MNGTVTYSRLGQNGRLANQLFQIAATIAYALDTKKDFVFPPWEYAKYFQKEIPQKHNLHIAPAACGHCEPHFHYAGIPHYPGDVELFGHYQSEKYFAHRREELLPYFKLKPEYNNHIWNKYGWHLKNKPTSCAIHVRRTDYDTPVNRDYHGVMPMSYYDDAIESLYGVLYPDDVLFVICSDDPEWCKENFKLPHMLLPEGEENIIDLFIMSFCRDNIIANSSFSWWSAWLNRNPGKRVVSPQKWFNNAPHNSKDVHCEKWIVI